MVVLFPAGRDRTAPRGVPVYATGPRAQPISPVR
jgi:hypothetical protein